MRIIIESWEDEPVVLENVEQFVMVADKGDGVQVGISAGELFLGYVIARLQAEFAESVRD